jgi:hypothetical protein
MSKYMPEPNTYTYDQAVTHGLALRPHDAVECFAFTDADGALWWHVIAYDLGDAAMGVPIAQATVFERYLLPRVGNGPADPKPAA